MVIDFSNKSVEWWKGFNSYFRTNHDFLHLLAHNKQTMSYDAIEGFRIASLIDSVNKSQNETF